MTNKDRLLQAISSDANLRSGLVEDLRCATALLDGSEPEILFDEITRTRVANKVARRLREIAQKLCDHSRTSSDDRCRYCECVVEEQA